MMTIQTSKNMIRRICSLTLFFAFVSTVSLYGQTPELFSKSNAQNRSLLACPTGANPSAGSTTQQLFANAQSSDIRFLCWGDSVNIIHDGTSDFSGDPIPSTLPGIAYIFYQDNCPPTVRGPELADVESDPCLLLTPPPPPGLNANFWVYRDGNGAPGSDPSGNTFFWNFSPNPMLSLQQFFNGGAPVEITYAPITLDNFFGGFEIDASMTEGPCIDANVDDAFTFVYLNEITATTPQFATGGQGCVGYFTVRGGLPEFDGSFYDSISITLSTDPNVQARFDTPISHDSVVVFTVPQAGIYNVFIEDGVSCGASFTVDMSSCIPVEFSLPDACVRPGEEICLPVTVNNFNNVASFDFFIRYDDTVLDDLRVNGAAIGPSDLQTNVIPAGFTVISWGFDLGNPNNMTTSFSDGTVLFEICFAAIGALGTNSDVFFSDDAANGGIELEVKGGSDPATGNNDNIFLAFMGNDGNVNISNCALVVTLTSCSGRQTGANPNQGTGSFTIEVNSGSAPYTYNWSQDGNPGNMGNGTITAPNGNIEVSNLAPGTYSVTVVDATGSQQLGSIVVADADPLFAQIDTRNPTCAGDADGVLWIRNVAGGVPPYTTSWSNGQMNVDTIRNLSQGNYDVTITDANGCSVVPSEGIGKSAVMVSLQNITDVNCSGPGDDGSITVLGSGGNPGTYTYLWDNSETTATINNLTTGTYCVTVTDMLGCTSGEECFQISNTDQPIIVSIDSVSVTCFTAADGSLTINAIPSPATNSPIVSYEWTLPDNTISTNNTNMLTGLTGGQYTVRITAMDGCTNVTTINLFAPEPLEITGATLTSPNCPGDADGTISLMVSGGQTPYSVTWSTGVMNSFTTLGGLVGDSTYSVTIVSANGCDSITLDTLLPNPPRIDIVFDPSMTTRVSCANSTICDGSAVALASGGTAGTNSYNFAWSSGEMATGVTTSTASQLCEGFNQVTVSDGNCFSIDSIEILAPPPVLIDPARLEINGPSCFDGDDGSITVAATGGTPGYMYEWDTGDTDPMIDNLMSGDYVLTITDVNGCEFITTITVQEPELLIAVIDTNLTNDVLCSGEASGQITVFQTGGTGPFSYRWENNISTTSSAGSLPPGTYTVTIIDANGCEDELSYTINEPPPIVATLNEPVPPECFGFQTSISVDTVFGGNGPPYTFSVNGGPPRRVQGAIPVGAGTFTVTIFDVEDCFVERIVSIDQPAPVVVSLGADKSPLELGDSVIITAQTAPPLSQIDSLLWSPTDSAFFKCLNADCSRIEVKPLETTVFTVTAVDENGCIGTDEILVDVDKNRNVYIPNIFTPNGDGFNDVFKPFVGVGVTSINYVRIFDRWGELVFESTPGNMFSNDDTTGGWDGSFRGENMNPGVYVYLAEISFIDGITLLYRGDVTIIR